MVEVKIRSAAGTVKAQRKEEDDLVLVWQGTYEEGDEIILSVGETDCFYAVRVDDGMDEELLYFKADKLVFPVPFQEKKEGYNPKAFTGDSHYLTLRKAREFEWNCYRNLAKNSLDQEAELGVYPHVSANVSTRGEAAFAVRNVIDGLTATESHGRWPYGSWGINRRDDAQLKLEFGRPVDVDTIVLYTRADFPHDNWWIRGTFGFSDGTKETVKLTRSAKAQVFHIEKKGIAWLTLGELVKSDDPSPFPSLSQIEVYGR